MQLKSFTLGAWQRRLRLHQDCTLFDKRNQMPELAELLTSDYSANYSKYAQATSESS